MPFRAAFILWKGEHFEEMAVRVAKVERLDSGGVFIPVRKPLRSGRSVLNLVLSKPRICSVHVAGDNGDMLEPAIIGPCFGGRWPTPGSQEFRQFDEFIAQAHSR